jgi:hypothetical protein
MISITKVRCDAPIYGKQHVISGYDNEQPSNKKIVSRSKPITAPKTTVATDNKMPTRYSIPRHHLLTNQFS